MLELHDLLQQMMTTLYALETVLKEEQQLLCAGRVDILQLQSVTLVKENHLAHLRHLDQQRQNARQQPPYDTQEHLAQYWHTLMTLTQQLHSINQHNGRLINQHLNRHQQALKTLQHRHGQTLYGPDGQTQSTIVSYRKLIT